MFIKVLIGIFLLFSPTNCFSEPIESNPPEQVAGVVIEGSLSHSEKKLLRILHKRMIPLPDTIKVSYRKNDNAQIRKMGSTINLGKSRFRTPKKAKGENPSLYGRVSATPSLPLPREYHTLTHELAHFLQWKMNNGSPSTKPYIWWKHEKFLSPFNARIEVEAELIAAAISSIAFGTTPNNLGYPKETWAGKTDSLVQKYRADIGDFYKLPVRSTNK